MTIGIYVLTIFGLFFFVVGTVGILRMPDTLSRIHAAAKCDSLGAGLIITALIMSRSFDAGTVKLILILCFLWITTPAAASAISSAKVFGNHSVDGLENIPRGERTHD